MVTSNKVYLKICALIGSTTKTKLVNDRNTKVKDDIIGRRQSRYEIKNDEHMQIIFDNVFIFLYLECIHSKAVYELQV